MKRRQVRSAHMHARWPLSRWLRAAVLLAAAFVSMAAVCVARPKDIDQILRDRMPRSGAGLTVDVEGLQIEVPPSFVSFYERRKYQPAWTGDTHPLLQLTTLLKSIGRAGEEGLRPADYVSSRIGAVLREIHGNQNTARPIHPGRRVDLDFLATHAFLTYASDLLLGRYNSDRNTRTSPAEGIDLAALLQTALEQNQIAESLKGLLPTDPGYARLREALALYQEITAQDGWVDVDGGPALKLGDLGPRIEQLRLRLLAEGDLTEAGPYADRDRFDAALGRALRLFQKRYGLEADGVLGPATVAALNVPALERLHQIGLNLDRWRWLPRDLGHRYLLVNIPDFRLQVIDNGHAALQMRVIVGKPATPTPLFEDQVTYLEFNPHWTIPDSIARRELLPLFRKDQQLLSKRKIKVLDDSVLEIDPDNIEWNQVTSDDFDYTLRQEPGPLNPLGRLKFGFAHHTSIHLHDAPARQLFNHTKRAFSHGCVRVEKAADLAEYLLRGDPGWTSSRIAATMDQGVEQVVRVAKPIRAYLVYWTAWVDESGAVQFRNDLYKHDRRLLQPCQQ